MGKSSINGPFSMAHPLCGWLHPVDPMLDTPPPSLKPGEVRWQKSSVPWHVAVGDVTCGYSKDKPKDMATYTILCVYIYIHIYTYIHTYIYTYIYISGESSGISPKG